MQMPRYKCYIINAAFVMRDKDCAGKWGMRMQQPTMVKQIGTVNGNECVYIEDYVYTYLNELKMGKGNFPLRAALFGHAYRKENRKIYLVYGAASVVDELEWGRNEEWVRKEYFEEYDLIGYVNIYSNKQELPGKKDGYYIFYDKNEPMQNYLLFCYEQKNRKVLKKEEKAGLGESKYAGFHRKTSVFSIKDILKRLLYGGGILILTVAVVTINDYDRMHGFVEAAGRAVALAEWGK